MPRPPRLEFPGAVYHVTARGNERRSVFRDDRDREDYLARIAFYRDKFRFRLLSYCLMTNHVHLAIRTAEAPLSRIMAGLHSSYTQRFNRRHRRVGHLFQGRYKSFVVQEDQYLLALIRYVHRNPVRAGIVRHAADYPWSSDRFLRKGRGPAWLDVDGALAAIGPTRRSAIALYAELVDAPATGDDESELRSVAGAVEGDEAFALERFAAAGELDPPLRGLTEIRILEAVAAEMGATCGELTGSRQGGRTAFARCLAAYVARKYAGIPVRRVARRLHRDDSSFVRPLARLERRLQLEPALRDQVDRILKTLRNREGQPNAVAPGKSANQD